MNKGPHYSTFLSTFTVNIIFIMLIIVGAAMTPLLSLQLNPTRYLPSLTISWSWPDAPVRVVEQEVTNLLEGMITTVTGVKKISSYSFNNGGRITVEFDKNIDLRDKRFEVAALLRQSREQLPDRVSYPEITMNMPSNLSGSLILAFQLNGNASPSYIYTIADEVIKPAIALIDGVYSIVVHGATPREWEITYDQRIIASIGIRSSSISSAIENYFLKKELGGAIEIYATGPEKRTYLTLIGNDKEIFRWDDIPVANISGRIIHLTDVAKVRLIDQRPMSYYRINGLNTVNISVNAGTNVNNIKVANKVKEVVEKLKKELPAGYSIITSIDNTIYLKEEIAKNIFRAVLSVVLLLLFVLAISREFKYLLIITISLVANVLIAFIFYYLFRLEIHLYSLAGITVSFGIIINNTIVMADHIRYRKNRKVGISLIAATLTTIGALTVIFFLDEASKISLSDFAGVIIINLFVSLAVALFFIPSLLKKIILAPKFDASVIRKKRRVVIFSTGYLKLINLILRRRVLLIIAAILLFGLPVFYIPDSLPGQTGSQQKEAKYNKLQKFFNKTMGNTKYVRDIKPLVNKVLGGTFSLFNERVKASRFYWYGAQDEVQRTRLTVNIGLSEEGLSIDDMNKTCIGLENILAGYSEIDMFTTNIINENEATISVTFKPEHDFTIFPYILKIRIEDYMNSIGSYHASVYGVGKAFSNQVYTDYIMTTYKIIMKGYNYDELYSYCEDLRERLIASGKGRIREVFLLGEDYGGYVISRNRKKVYRNMLEMDRFHLAGSRTDVAFAYNEIKKYSRSTASSFSVYTEGSYYPVSIKALQSEKYDYWSLENEPVRTASGQYVKLKDFSNISREVSDNTIRREDQQYVITVGYDFIGNYELGQLILDRNIKETNSLLPLGYTAQTDTYRFSWFQQKANYLLIFLVIIIIYFICSILLESFRQPFVVISLIPFSFIGVFITFHIFRIAADEGVFAAMILLCGIVVNATLYILNDFNSIRRNKPKLHERVAYLKAFNGKIVPITLSILATIIGLVPFLLTGKDERFWFALAAGTISGLAFSFVGLIFYQPMMLKKTIKPRSQNNVTS